MQMKQIYFLAIIFFSICNYAQDCNIGNEMTNSNFNPSSFGVNYLLGVKFNLSQEGTLNSINLIGNNSGSGVQMAVYDDNAGIPNNLVTSSAIGVVGNGVISLPVTPIVLPAGNYWIMAVYQNGGNHSQVDSSASANVVYFKDLLFGNTIPNNASDFYSYSGQDFLYFLDIDCGNTLSIENSNLDNRIALFPNPTKNHVQFTNLNHKENIKIYTTLGQEVFNEKVELDEKIIVDKFENGLYFVKFENGNILKFIKE